MSRGKVLTKEKKKAGQNWGKPRKWEQKKGSKRLRKLFKLALKKILSLGGE